MKSHLLLNLAAALLATSAQATSHDISALRARDEQILRHEERFIDTLSYVHPNDTIKLIGFKKIIMTDAELADLERDIAALPREWAAIRSAYYDPLERAMRVYFPVENALVRHAGAFLEANRLGELPHPRVDGDCAVVARYQTAQVRGVPANRVADGVIHLAEPSPVLRRHGSVHVYDFGWRHGSHHHRHESAHGSPAPLGVSRRGEGEGGTCYQNHNNRVCSVAYGIDNGRCSQPKDRGKIKDCIDYNGWPHKNCDNHSDKLAFPLSDCFTAVARGHCWNEVEGALRGHGR